MQLWKQHCWHLENITHHTAQRSPGNSLVLESDSKVHCQEGMEFVNYRKSLNQFQGGLSNFLFRKHLMQQCLGKMVGTELCLSLFAVATLSTTAG